MASAQTHVTVAPKAPVRVNIFVYSERLADLIHDMAARGIVRNLRPAITPALTFLRGFAKVHDADYLVYVAYGCSKVYGVLVSAEVCDPFIRELDCKLQVLAVTVEDSKYQLHEAITLTAKVGGCAGAPAMYEALSKSISARREGRTPVGYDKCDTTWDKLVGIAKKLFGEGEVERVLGKREDFNRLAGCRGDAYVPPPERPRESRAEK